MKEQYLFCMDQAAKLGAALGHKELIALEFGVAEGQGLLEMLAIAADIESRRGVKYHIFGFDTGYGLPESADYRDLPFNWRRGDYNMGDQATIIDRVRPAQIIFGDVAQTASTFVSRATQTPIGMMAFDLDYYSSTRAALCGITDCIISQRFLPRTFCYFDDVIGDDCEIHCNGIGELLAIKEFNEDDAGRMLSQIPGLSHKRGREAFWHEMVYVLHFFRHARYNAYVRDRY